jgi:hypothetical protein
MIHSPASVPIGNETDMTRDIIFRHCTVSLTERYFPPIEAIASTYNPGFPFYFPIGDSTPPIAAAAIFFCIRSGAKEPDASGMAFARTQRP